MVNRQRKFFLASAVLFLGLGVLFGALGAHSLRGVLSDAQMNSFNTAVRYQVWMGFGLALTVLIGARFLQDRVRMVGWLLIIGTLLFSGSIYVLTALPSGHSMRSIIGVLTPFGGILLIIAWLLLFVRILSSKSVG